MEKVSSLIARAGPPPSGGGGGGHGGPDMGPSTGDVNNMLYGSYILIVLSGLAASLVLYRVLLGLSRHLRKVVCLNNSTQLYFAQATPWVSALKRHLLYAPLFRARHQHDLYLTRRWSLGILPTRLQSLILAGIVAMNVALCVTGIEWGDAGGAGLGPANMLSHFRNRCGALAVANMVPLVLMAGRNNPLLKLTGLSYDTFNLMHRWFGRICVFEAVAHMVTHFVKMVNYNGGWKAFPASLQNSQLILTGFIAFCFFITIYFTAWTAFRRAFYEVFCHLHAALALAAMAALWYHLEDLQPQAFLKAAVGLWAFERGVRLLTLLYRNVGGNGGTMAVVELLPGEALRVTLHLARPWTFEPGQHAFITIPSVGLWTAHPFSVAWSGVDEGHGSDPGSPSDTTLSDPEKGLSAPAPRAPRHTVSAIVRRRNGFTQSLHAKAAAAPTGRLHVRAFVEGPYGAAATARAALGSYGTVLLVAGGVGITHQLPILRALIIGHANGTCATRRLTLVWTVQAPEHLDWVRAWMTQVLALPKRREVLRVMLFVTRPRSARELSSPSTTVQVFPGRPNVERLVGMEVEAGVGAVGVGVCGPGALTDAVRKAVRKQSKEKVVDLVEESFSW